MNLATVAVKNIRRHVLRNTLTILGVGVATLAFILLRTTLSAWAIGTENAAKDRIATRHKVTFIIPLPSRYVQEVRAVDGVQAATWMNWFGGRVPGREEDFFASMACDPETLFQVYDELHIGRQRLAVRQLEYIICYDKVCMETLLRTRLQLHINALRSFRRRGLKPTEFRDTF